MTQELSHDALHTLGQAIASALGAAWTLTPLPEGCRWVELRHTEGYGFHLSNSWPRGRLTISGVWPHSATGESFAPWGHGAKITVTAEGKDEAKVIEALDALVSGGFAEGK